MENRPKRKPVRMSWYDYGTAGMYFLTLCTKEKQKLFGNIVGDGAFDVPQVCLTNIGKIVEKYILSTNKIPNITVENFVIMPNHIHLLISVAEDGTSRAPSPT